MNLEQQLEIARVRAEKLNSLKQEIKTSAEVYNGLLPTEGYYDSFAEQFERREQRVVELEKQLEQAMAELDFWKERVSKMVNSSKEEDPIEHQLRSVSWNLNRIANVIEENFALSDAQSMLAKLRQKGGK